MPRKKLEITATEEQLNKLYTALNGGTPLTLALQFSGISAPTYYYWVAMDSIVQTVKNQEELEELERLAKSGVSIQEIRELASSVKPQKRTGIDAYIEPKQESILAYKNSRKFKKFADKCYEIIEKCTQLRSAAAMSNIIAIKKSTSDRHVNPSGAMWWLERNMPDLFSKVTEQKDADIGEKPITESIHVEFIDSDTVDQHERL